MLKRKITFYLSFLLITLSLFSFTSETTINVTKPKSEKKEIRFECKHNQCQATAKSTGSQCKHCVSNEGDLYCWQHIKK